MYVCMYVLYRIYNILYLYIYYIQIYTSYTIYQYDLDSHVVNVYCYEALGSAATSMRPYGSATYMCPDTTTTI
jgi:hypothetical protein